MIDEHTRESLLNLVERSITAKRLVAELETVFAAAGGPPKVLRMDNGPELVSQALQRFCDGKAGTAYMPPGQPWENGYIESFNNRLRKECLNRNHWNTLLEARVVIGDFKHEHNHRHAIRPWATERQPSTLRRAGTSTPRSPARSTESETTNPTLRPGGLSNGDSPSPLMCAPRAGPIVLSPAASAHVAPWRNVGRHGCPNNARWVRSAPQFGHFGCWESRKSSKLVYPSSRMRITQR